MPTVLNDTARPAPSVLERTAGDGRYAAGFCALDDDAERFRGIG